MLREPLDFRIRYVGAAVVGSYISEQLLQGGVLIANAVTDRETVQTPALETDAGGEDLAVPAKI